MVKQLILMITIFWQSVSLRTKIEKNCISVIHILFFILYT